MEFSAWSGRQLLREDVLPWPRTMNDSDIEHTMNASEYPDAALKVGLGISHLVERNMLLGVVDGLSDGFTVSELGRHFINLTATVRHIKSLKAFLHDTENSLVVTLMRLRHG
jgi:hypothetical protein